MATRSVVLARSIQTPQTPTRARKNRLLAFLPSEAYEQLLPHLTPVTLKHRITLYKANEPIEFVHFIETGVASLVNTMTNGSAIEVGTIGNEGLVGLPIIFGDKQAPTSVYMQVAGGGLKMKADLFRKQMQRNAVIQSLMLHYANAFFNQVAQFATCNAFHPLERRLCRWLLMTYDRMRSRDFPLTQECLAMVLGVRRSGVTVAANRLRRAGLIDYTRGHITILDHKGLQKRSCECYGITKREFDRLLGRPALSQRQATTISD